MNDVLKALLTAPASELDPVAALRLKVLEDKEGDELRVGLHEVLDYCARYALASDFVMRILDYEWKKLGGQPDDPAPWREKME